MNSRGTRIAHRITGDTLAISDRVAMTPTVQPAAAGTQRSRELDSIRGRDAVRVTDGEDIRYCYGMPMIGLAGIHRVGRNSPGLGGRRRGDVSEQGVMTGRLTLRDRLRLSQRQQEESRSHRWP